MLTSLDTELLIEQYMTWCEDRARHRPATLRVYREGLEAFRGWIAARGMTLTDVRPEDVEDFGNRPRRAKGGGTKPAAASTARREIVTVRQFYKWLQMKDVPVRSMELAKSPTVHDENPKPVDDDLWLPVWTSDLDPQDRLFLGLGYYLGLRRIEIVNVAPDAVKPDMGYMKFIRKGGMQHPIEYLDMIGAIEDELPHLAVRTSEFLDILHETASFRAFRGYPTLWWDVGSGERYDMNRLNKRLGRILKAAGLPRDTYSPHQLRHSCATNLFRAGVQPEIIRNLLNHVSLTTTMRYMRTSGQLGRWRRRRTG